MDSIELSILNNLSEGIVIINDDYKIVKWNNFMELITRTNSSKAVGSDLFKVLPGLNKNFLISAIHSAIISGAKVFFSAALHQNLVDSNKKLNLKISRFTYDEKIFLILEFIDVTNQFEQIAQLKKYVKNLSDLNEELTNKEKIIRNLAYYDGLTGVANRNLFYKLANNFLTKDTYHEKSAALIFLDVDKFKNINDEFGHDFGDKILRGAAFSLKKIVDKDDILARYGGDEFLIFIPNVSSISECDKIINDIERKITIELDNDITIGISFSIGISFYPQDGTTIEQLINSSDKSMYCAKRSRIRR